MNEHIDILHALAKLLLEKETVLGKELDELILSIEPDARLFGPGHDEQAQQATAQDSQTASAGDEDQGPGDEVDSGQADKPDEPENTEGKPEE